MSSPRPTGSALLPAQRQLWPKTLAGAVSEAAACLAMALVYLVQHGEKEAGPGDPGLTNAGRDRACSVGRWLRTRDVRRLYCSPLRRARETAEAIAAEIGQPITVDPRLRERVNWDGNYAFETFLEDWRHSIRDRDFAPPGGDSSRQAGERMRAFLQDVSAQHGTAAAVTHGGVTTDLLRTLLGDDQIPVRLLRRSVPACAITTISDMQVIEIASMQYR